MWVLFSLTGFRKIGSFLKNKNFLLTVKHLSLNSVKREQQKLFISQKHFHHCMWGKKIRLCINMYGEI